jgi:ribosomal protein L37AE/L43A
MGATLKETADVLDAMIADGEAEGFGTRYDTEILAALKELKAIRAGERTCSRCRMREAENEAPLEF